MYVYFIYIFKSSESFIELFFEHILNAIFDCQPLSCVLKKDDVSLISVCKWS